MDLSSVPFFKRPIQSSAKDQWIGQDEAGNNVYKMSNGQTYTVKPDADQRTTRTKVEEDVIPAVKEYAEDPSLPSAEDMKQFGMDVATGAYESLKGAVEGTGTMGDVFGVAPAMAALGAGAKVPEGAIRSFGGLSEGALDSLKEYNEGVRIPKGLLDRDMVNKNDNILYRPDRSYRFIGKEGFEDFQSSGLIRARPGSKQGYEVPYFMKGKSSSRYGQGEGGEYLVETVPTGDWKNAASADDKYHGPTNPLTKEDPIRIFKRNESGEFEVVFDNIGDEALLTSLEPKGFNQGGSVSMDLKNVPFFNRPMGASEKDQWVGQDEAGNNVYKMGNGSTYTVKPDADQRTFRTKIEEDVIPAVKDFAENPSLPSAEQMKQFGVDVAQGTYDSIKGAVEGTGTMGDVFGVAPAMAVASAPFEVPEGAVRLFGGNRAESPGYTRSHRDAPESFGADGEYRFEIDDSEMFVIPNNISEFDGTVVTKDTKLPTLADVTIHDELFYQYPDLGDTKVFADTTLRPETWGYFQPKTNSIAVNPNLLKPGQEETLKKLLLHEIQHKIQEVENFARGTNPRASEVNVMTAQRINSPKNEQDWKFYEQEVREFEKVDKLVSPLRLAEDFIDEYAKQQKLRLDEAGFMERLGQKVGLTEERSILENNLRAIKKNIQDRLKAHEEGSVSDSVFNSEVGSINQIYRTLASLTSNDDLAAETFMAITDINPKALYGWESTGSSNAFDFFYMTPEMPELPAPGTTHVGTHVLHSTYERKRGEVEANNAMARAGLTLQERFDTPPESTEMYPRDEQWGDAPQYNKGGLVPMDEQMKAFSEGGMAEKVDPVSGNEVPPGSLPEEVRDDVDAKLSEGEYVVPADVVRFFGVGYFEKLREKAKKALAEMDADGRIGGEPVPEDEDDFPFSDDELMTVDEAPVGMAEGGVVSGFNPANFMAGFSAQGSGVQNKTFINKEGQQRTIMFVNGQPIQQIPAGFVEATAENKAELTKQQSPDTIPTGEVKTEFEGGVGTDGTDGGFAPVGPDIGSMNAEELGEFADNFSSSIGAMQGLASLAGPLGAAVVGFGKNQTSNAVAARADELGVPNPLGKEGKQGLVGKAIDAVMGRGAPSEADMAAAAPAGMTYSGETGGYSRSGSAAPTSSPNPPSMSAAMAAQTGRSPSTPSASTSGSTSGGGSSSGSSGSSSGTSGGMGDGPGYGGWAARGMLVDKKVRQKQVNPKPEGKGLVKRKAKK